MKIQIKSIAGSILFEGDFSCLKDALLSAIKSRANLLDANLSGADLSCAYLSGANLSGADLSGADLSRADGGGLVIAKTRILPDGDLIGWKKCCGGKIVKLLIPAAAKRSHAFGRKCRAEFAKVLEISEGNTATSQHSDSFVYKAGETVRPTEPFDENWQDECASGIHFYITRIEAENH